MAASIPSGSSRTTFLPPSHPLIAELSSLRQQLQQYQKATHQSSIQLQGAKLELNLLKEKYGVLEGTAATLRAEVEGLRQHPAPPATQPQSTALTELSLAHRRLSAKLDLTESQLSAQSLELASARQEIARLNKEREGDRATINDFRRIEEDREEEIEWEKAARRKAEEQKKLCDLALQEYSQLVHSLDPTAVPPAVPSNKTPNILHTTPELAESSSAPLESPFSAPHSSADAISNLLIGQKGVHRLFNDFTSTLSSKEKALQSAHAKIEELERSLRIVEDQLESETSIRVAAQNDREAAMRDDGSAAKVVERYMTFTQKTHATVHMHLDNLRARSTATQTSLRIEIASLRNQLSAETCRAEKLRSALDEISEGTSREAAGRRREVALRLKMLAIEEKRERKVEAWLDKVNRARQGAEGAVVEPDILDMLLDAGIEAVEKEKTDLKEPKAWKRILKKKPVEPLPARDEREESLTRVLLAEDLVNTLVTDLQMETERRMELERQRVDWLAKDAIAGAPVPAALSEVEGEMMFDYDAGNEPNGHVEETESADLLSVPMPPPRTPSPLPDTPPLLPQLQEKFGPLTERYEPLQKRLHDLSHSLTSLRSVPPTPQLNQRKPLLNLSRRSDHTLVTMLDSVHEVIEDARVDAEIALADEERVFRGFEALLGVGKTGAVQGKEVLRDADEYIQHRTEWEGFSKLQRRIDDIESDITGIKRIIHENEGLDIGEDELTKWSDIELRTVSLPTRHPISPVEIDEKRRGSQILASVGRSFSSGIVGAPRRVGSFAGGLYRKDKKDIRDTGDAQKDGLLDGKQGVEDDVE